MQYTGKIGLSFQKANLIEVMRTLYIMMEKGGQLTQEHVKACVGTYENMI